MIDAQRGELFQSVVERTQVAGMSDFLVGDDSHRFMLRSATVLENTVAFLRSGRFLQGRLAQESG